MDTSGAIRQALQLWRKKEPWFYSRFIFNEYTYYFLSLSIISLALASLMVYPISHLLAACAIGYFLSQFIFQFGHMTTHALYVESPVEDWEPGVVVAWLHHYIHPRAIYDHWLIHRLNFIMQTKGCAVAYIGAWIAPFALFGTSLALLYIWFLFWFLMVEPVHEWYHVPKGVRKSHFSAPVYYWLSLLSFVQILDEEGHLEHHRHSLSNAEKVTKFSDLYSPCADMIFDRLWGMALAARNKQLFKTSPIRKTIYLQGVLLIPLVFSFSAWLFYFACENFQF